MIKEKLTLIEIISGINQVIQEQDQIIQDAMAKGQKKYMEAIEEAKKEVEGNSEFAYELGRFVSNPQQYELPEKHITKPEKEKVKFEIVGANGSTLN